MISKVKIIKTIVTIITLLLLAGLVVFLMLPFGLDLKKHLPVPEMSDKEVSGLLEALRLPDTTKISAMRVVFLKDGEDISMSVRVRIDRDQLDEIIRESWMKSHQGEASKSVEYSMMLPPMYEIDWWELFPLQAGDRRFYLPLELPLRSYPGSIMAVVRKVGPDVDLYFRYSASIEHFPPVVLEAMRRGRSPDPGIPSQTHMYEVKKGEFKN